MQAPASVRAPWLVAAGVGVAASLFLVAALIDGIVGLPAVAPCGRLATDLVRQQLVSTSPMVAQSPLPQPAATHGQRALMRRKRGAHSGFQCVGGSQAFPGMDLFDVQTTFWPEADILAGRVCLLHDVCWRNGQIEYYRDAAAEAAYPAYARVAAFADIKGMVFAGYHPDLNQNTHGWMPTIVDAPVPTDVVYGPRATYILDTLSYAQNYAHLMVDSLWGGHAAAAMWDFDMHDAQFVGLTACGGGLSANRREDCEQSLARWTPVLSDHAYLPLPSVAKPVCFGELVVGAGTAFSLKSLHVLRGLVMRSMRQFAWAKLGLLPLPPLAEHHVVAITKLAAARRPAYPEICDDVAGVAARMQPPVKFTCVVPDTGTDAKSQVALMTRATVVLVEHGSVSYVTRFARAGAVAVHLSQALPQQTLDVNIFLHDQDVQTLYMSSEPGRRGDLPGMMLLALASAGERLGLAMPTMRFNLSADAPGYPRTSFAIVPPG
jgi:hypothetical protein